MAPMLSGPLFLLVPNEAHLRKIKASFRCLRVTTVTCFPILHNTITFSQRQSTNIKNCTWHKVGHGTYT